MNRFFLIILFTLIALLLWNIPLVSAQFSEAGVEKFRVPVEAPEFALTDLSGSKISLKELRGKVIVLNFFATW
ncbi:MAG: redoxin domain-containing protein [Syntrophaceae bacterium]|nr:redoxin domain-containing protein [Syntrophaceae bacterium]